MNVLETTVPILKPQRGQQLQGAQPEEPIGLLALHWTGKRLSLEVCSSGAGFYLGTYDEDGPCSRESVEYWPKRTQAVDALASGSWTQRLDP